MPSYKQDTMYITMLYVHVHERHINMDVMNMQGDWGSIHQKAHMNYPCKKEQATHAIIHVQAGYHVHYNFDYG